MPELNLTSDRKAIVAVKDLLQANLTDPRQQYTNDTRNWIHTDEPLDSATYPRIQVSKRIPTVGQIISMGEEFIEQKSMQIDIQMWSKAPFKWKNTDNNYLQDEELIKEWLDKIWVCIKAQQPTLKTTYGITGLKNLNEGVPYLEPNTELFTGILTIRLWYFRQ